MMKKAAVAVFIAVCAAVFAGVVSNDTSSRQRTLSASEIQSAYKKSIQYEKSKSYSKAASAMGSVVAVYPDAYTPNLRLGWLNYLDKKYDKSEQYYQKAVAAAPDSIEARLGYTLPLLARGKYKQAEEAAGKIIKTDALNYTANLRLAYALRMQNKCDSALKTANKMLALYPSDVSFMAEQALCYLAKGDKDSAAAVMWNVKVLDPENAAAKQFYGK